MTIREKNDSPTHYAQFAQSLRLAQQPWNGDLTKREWANAQLDLQNNQIPEMLRAERAFMDALMADRRLSKYVLSEFISHVRSAKKPASAARAYFRERNVVFVREVSSAIERNQLDRLAGLAVNWAFLMFAWQHIQVDDVTLSRRLHRAAGSSLLPVSAKAKPARLPLIEKLIECTEDLGKTRSDLVVTNLQLVVDRAMAFYRCTPQSSQATEMDMISVATEGLLAGIDKVMIECEPVEHWPPSWHPAPELGAVYWRGQSAALPDQPFAYPNFVVTGYRVSGHHTAPKHESQEERPKCPASVFRTTSIGRMGGKMIQNYSQTHMHMGPDDKRLLYQANRVAARYSDSGTPDYAGMAQQILLDRVSFTISQKMIFSVVDQETNRTRKASLREVANMVSHALEENDGDWEQAALALAASDQRIVGIVSKARSKAPTPSAVAEVMLSNSVVSVVDEEGEDRLNEATSYAAPAAEQPDHLMEKESLRREVNRALGFLSLIERKLLVLLGLAPLECVIGETV